MLVLTREREEAIMIGHQIEIRVLEIKGDRVRLGIIAPPEVPIHRKEVYLAIHKDSRPSPAAPAAENEEKRPPTEPPGAPARPEGTGPAR